MDKPQFWCPMDALLLALSVAFPMDYVLLAVLVLYMLTATLHVSQHTAAL